MVYFILQYEECREEGAPFQFQSCVLHYTYCDSAWLCTVLSGSQEFAACS